MGAHNDASTMTYLDLGDKIKLGQQEPTELQATAAAVSLLIEEETRILVDRDGETVLEIFPGKLECCRSR